MSDRNATVQIQFDDGEILSAWESVVWRDRYDDPLGSLRLSVAPPRDQLPRYLEKLQRGNLITLKLGGKAVHTPIIVQRQFSSTRNGPRLDIEAQSVLVTPYEGSASLDLNINVDADTPISDIVLDALGPYGFDTLESNTADHVSAVTGKSISGRAPAIPVNELKERDWQVQPGETAYNYCQRLMSRLGLVLRVDFKGTLLVGRPDYDQAALYGLHQCDGQRTGNRIADGYTVAESNKGQHSHCVVAGKSPDALKRTRSGIPFGGFSWDNYTPPTATFGKVAIQTYPAGLAAYRSQGAAYKPLFRADDDARDVERCNNWAARLMGARASSAWVMDCEVDGLISVEGAMWAVDTVANVYLQDLGIDSELWVYEVTKTMSRAGSQRTRMKLIPKNALILTLDA